MRPRRPWRQRTGCSDPCCPCPSLSTRACVALLRATDHTPGFRKGKAIWKPDAAGSMKEGVVNYRSKPDDEFQQFVWFALRTGVLDIISH